MRAKGVHERLWNYCLHYKADIHSHLWNPKTGRTGWESVFGNTLDISEYLDFEMYSWVWFGNLVSRTRRLVIGLVSIITAVNP